MEDKKVYSKGEYVIGHGTPIQTLVRVNNGLFEEWDPTKKSFKVLKLDERALLPEVHYNSAGIDLRVLTEDSLPITIKAHSCYKFHTGIAIEPPEDEYVQIYVRSSTGCKKELVLMNGTGIIDSDYRGEILVFVRNEGEKDVIVENNERLCQMVFAKRLDRVPVWATSLSDTKRGIGGFGSTGDK